MIQGEYPGLEAERYHTDPALGSGDLKHLLRSPAHFKDARERGFDASSESQLKGSIVHCAILEPAALPSRYHPAPEGLDKRTKAGKAAWEEALQEAGKRTLVPLRLWEAAQAVADRALCTAQIQAAIQGGRPESSFFAEDDACAGLQIKARPDYWSPNCGKRGMILDLKTTRDASAFAFRGAVGRYGYHMQAAHYQKVLEIVTRKAPAFVIVAIETSPPYALALYELDPHWIEEGRRKCREAKLNYVSCTGSQEWPGYPPQIQTLSMPNWRLFDDRAFGTFGDGDGGDGGGPFDLPGIID